MSSEVKESINGLTGPNGWSVFWVNTWGNESDDTIHSILAIHTIILNSIWIPLDGYQLSGSLWFFWMDISSVGRYYSHHSWQTEINTNLKSSSSCLALLVSEYQEAWELDDINILRKPDNRHCKLMVVVSGWWQQKGCPKQLFSWPPSDGSDGVYVRKWEAHFPYSLVPLSHWPCHRVLMILTETCISYCS